MADGISVAWEGLQGLYEAIQRTADKADEAAREVVTRSAAIAEAEIKANFSGAHKKGQPHVGGSQPNIVSGSLRRSVHADPVVRFGLSDYGTVVGPRMVYGRRVELGYFGSHTVTAHTRKIAGPDGKKRKVKVREHTRSHENSTGGAYPYVKPGQEKATPKMQAVAAEVWRAFLTG